VRRHSSPSSRSLSRGSAVKSTVAGLRAIKLVTFFAEPVAAIAVRALPIMEGAAQGTRVVIVINPERGWFPRFMDGTERRHPRHQSHAPRSSNRDLRAGISTTIASLAPASVVVT
jgi:hypothetical protein